MLLGRRVRKLERLYDELLEHGPEPAIYPMDLAGAQPKDFDDLNERISQQLGSLHGIAHCAGLLGNLGPLERYDPATWAHVIHVNLNAPFLLTKACMPSLRAADNASIVFTVSGANRSAGAYWGAYGVAQYGLLGLMQILADEVEVNTNIRVSCFDPGPVATPLRASAFPAEDRTKLRTPTEVAPFYAYLMAAEQLEHGQTWALGTKESTPQASTA